MKQLNTILLFCMISLHSFGQGVQIIYQNKDYKPNGKYESFHYIDKKTVLSDSVKIASLKGYSTNSGNQTLSQLFNEFWKIANKLGANAFRIDCIENKSVQLFYITISIYNLNEGEINYDFLPKNMIYIIGDLNYNKGCKNIKLNENKMSIYPMEYISYQNKVGEEAIISIGGFTGAKTWIKGKEGRLPECFTLSNFGVGPTYYGGSGVGVSFNTGRIYPVDLSFGLFLIEILKKK